MATQGRASGLNLTDILKRVEQRLEGVQKEFLKNLVEDIVSISPVDTGSYVNGHNVQADVGSAGGQFTSFFESGKSSLNPQAEKDQALGRLNNQIDSLPRNLNKVSINNRVPHAYKVEYGGWSKTGPYQVYNTAINRAEIHLNDAIAKVKGST